MRSRDKNQILRSGGDAAFNLDDEITSLAPDRNSFGFVGAVDALGRGREVNVFLFHEFGTRFDMNRVAPGAQPAWVAARLSSPDDELPAMPGASDNLAIVVVLDVARDSRFHCSPALTFTQRATLVRATIPKREELTTNVKDTNRDAFDFDDFSSTDRNFLGQSDNVLHCSPYSLGAFSK